MNKTKRTRFVTDWSEITVDGNPVCWIARLDDGEVVVAHDLPVVAGMEMTMTTDPVGDLVSSMSEDVGPEVGQMARDENGQTASQRRSSERLRRMAEAKADED